MSEQARNYVDKLLAGLQDGSIQRLPDGSLRGANLCMGLCVEPGEVERTILSMNPGAADEVQRFRAYLAGKGDTTTAPAQPPATHKEPEREPTLAERTLQSLRQSLAELDFRMSNR